MWKEIKLLKDHPDLHPQPIDIPVMHNRTVIDENIPLVDLFEPVDTSKKRRFSRSGRADDHDDFARINIKRHAAKRLNVIFKIFINVANTDNRVSRFFHHYFSNFVLFSTILAIRAEISVINKYNSAIIR